MKSGMGRCLGPALVCLLTMWDRFGAIHDCTSGCSLSGSCCPLTTSTCDANGQFIMNPTTSTTEQTFSGCTLGNICSNIGNRAVSTSCIETPGARSVISLQQCGSEFLFPPTHTPSFLSIVERADGEIDGIVEDGEDCDPGGNTTSTCCDSSSKFKSLPIPYF